MRCIILFILSIVIFIGCNNNNDVIKLGSTLPLTGEVASYGQNAKSGFELAVQDVNGTGGVLGKKVVIDFQDDKNSPKDAVSIVNKFVTIDKVPIIFGSAGSTVTLSIIPITDRSKTLLVTPISSSSKLTKDGGKYFFRTVPDDDLQAKVLAKWVNELGYKRVAIVFTNNSWGKPLADGFETRFIQYGGSVLLKEGMNENSDNFRTIIAKLKQIQGLDAVVSPTYPKDGAAFVKQSKELGLKVQLIGGDNWGSPEFIEKSGNAAEGVYFTGPTKSQSPEFPNFKEKFINKYGKEPDIFSAYAYDAANAVFKAINRAGEINTEKISQELRKITFMGVSGEIRFDEYGDLITQGFDRNKIVKSTIQSVK